MSEKSFPVFVVRVKRLMNLVLRGHVLDDVLMHRLVRVAMSVFAFYVVFVKSARPQRNQLFLHLPGLSPSVLASKRAHHYLYNIHIQLLFHPDALLHRSSSVRYGRPECLTFYFELNC